MSYESPQTTEDTVQYTAPENSVRTTRSVYLSPVLADRMANTNHVIVTKLDSDMPDVKWSDVDKEELQRPYSAGRIPSSKIVGAISSLAQQAKEKSYTLQNDVSSINSSVSSLQLSVNALLISADGLSAINNKIDTLSNNLSGLFGQNVTKFIGVSETDPRTGIVTIDGIVYHLSDFNDTNNGNVIYYRNTISNHDHENPLAGDAVSMLYAYIYSNGVLNDVGSAQLDSSQTQHGSFHKYGYSFFENLSTLIHDDMVCDYANIKITKISGLQEELSKNTSDHSYLSGRIDALNNNLNNYQLKTSAEISARDLLSSINTTNTKLDQLSTSLSDYLPKNVRVNNLNSYNSITVPTTEAVVNRFNDVNQSIIDARTALSGTINNTSSDILQKLQLSVNNILDILSATLRPEVNSVNKRNQIISNYTW